MLFWMLMSKITIQAILTASHADLINSRTSHLTSASRIVVEGRI